MLAKITLRDGTAATLGDDERWRSASAELAARLNRDHPPGGPADGWPGRLQASRAARELAAELWLPELPEGGGMY